MQQSAQYENPPPGQPQPDVAALQFPRVLRRVQAVFIDSLVFPAVFFLLLYCTKTLQIESGYVRAACSALPAILFEPVMIAFSGGSVGHHVLGLRVRHSRYNKNINIINATLRFVFKVVAGVYSFFFVFLTGKHQTLHDIVSQSIVVHKNPAELPAREVLAERRQDPRYRYPTRFRRAIVIVLYLLLILFVLAVVTTLMLNVNCLDTGRCSSTESLLEGFISITWLLTSLLVIIAGIRARLFGCRKTLILAPVQ